MFVPAATAAAAVAAAAAAAFAALGGLWSAWALPAESWRSLQSYSMFKGKADLSQPPTPHPLHSPVFDVLRHQSPIFATVHLLVADDKRQSKGRKMKKKKKKEISQVNSF